MQPVHARRESDWVDAQRTEDLTGGTVISFNYDYERHHQILKEAIRVKFVETQIEISSLALITIRPSVLYRDSIAADREFWIAGEAVRLEHRLVMVKHGRTLFREQWSFLSCLAEYPDDATVEAAMDGHSSAESWEHKALRLGTANEEALRNGLANDPIRQQFSRDMVAAGCGPLSEARSWDSYGAYRKRMVQQGYIPVWWVTTAAALAQEMSSVDPDARAVSAAAALGLSDPPLGPYYAVEIPLDTLHHYVVYKPTTLSGGFPDNFCAVAPPDAPGMTARLETGELGLVEAIMIPLDSLDHRLKAWRVIDCLGVIDKKPPRPNTRRITERLKI